ncbi:hypothetical protein BCV70DRAFT_36926 [Testicularia cyperi]|uniref:Uncharacterized protein n=1 Tax=Testicularia cyperi TaxID=1882483 RepID=A0A317XIZ6_9BASI|nr:hypothetical protein BCV70DRAFT_36926 [Testicularia cyperi]
MTCREVRAAREWFEARHLHLTSPRCPVAYARDCRPWLDWTTRRQPFVYRSYSSVLALWVAGCQTFAQRPDMCACHIWNESMLMRVGARCISSCPSVLTSLHRRRLRVSFHRLRQGSYCIFLLASSLSPHYRCVLGPSPAVSAWPAVSGPLANALIWLV